MAVFDKNGILVMGNKTPITILHETLSRKGVTPNYELIFSSATTNDPIFKYQVSALGFTAIGDGKTKKEAKHDAAAGLLRRMRGDVPDVESVESELAESVVASPYTGALKENYIGMLEDICMTNKIPFAEFNSISELGPPHARIFTMQCKLSSCTEVAVARTKKQAKHMAAQQMISRVEDILGNKFVPVQEKIVDYDNPEEPSNLKDIENGTYQHEMSIPLADLHNIFHIKREELRVPDEFFELYKEPLNRFKELENPKQYLEILVRKLEGICKTRVASNSASEVQREASPTEHFLSSYKTKSHSTWMQPEDSSVDIELLMKELGFTIFTNDSDLSSDGDIEAEVPNEQPMLESGINALEANQHQSTEVDENAEKYTEKPSGKEFGPDNMNVMVYLTIVCPQGEYVFVGIESDIETAEKKAAIEALDFLRVMSYPRYVKQDVAAPLLV